MKFIATFAFLCALTFLTVEAQKYTKKNSCSRERKVCEKGFYFSKHDCACRCGLRSRDCFYPQQLNKTACECQCPPELNESKCINWQEWDDDWCECYCPYSRHHKCPSKKVWNYKNCHCDCINKEPKGGCINGKWNKNECQCIPNPTTTTTKVSTTKTTATTKTIQPTTTATTTVTTTTAVPLCSYGSKAYNNDNSIDGIAAGPAVDGTNVYVGFTQVNGITIPGMLMLNNSVLPGLTYIYNNNVTVKQTSNIFYLTNTPDCNCQFVDKNASLPVGSYINYDKFDTITADYQILVCGLPLNFITTTTLSPNNNKSSANNTSTVSTTTDYAKQIDDSVNGFIVLMNDATQTITNLNTIKDDSISFINKSLADSNTTKNDALIYQELFNIFNSPIVARRRKDKQLMIINQCKQRLSELTAIRDDVCSKTTTTIPTTTTTPVSCGGGDLAPGSLEPLYLNGVTVQSSYVVYNVTTNVTYLAIPSSCKCNWLPNGDLYNIPALVRLRNFYWIGRYNFTDGSHVVGKFMTKVVAME
ncbi:hypothetical protein PVAND_017028 [Polypedilum vanderplanki]|uniref:Uncharacterized protein n=1 Tax=Polypedilum vanderplanki TaxID=319348 RepID=A0A9J6BH11_POLVA|nr:hypothetical protein PVAND_017028 [Polypedilum vanderplanki]